MSKIGKQPVQIPDGVAVNILDNEVKVSGPKGELTFKFRPEVKVEIDGSNVRLSRKNETKFAKALHGLTRSIIANMVIGTVKGHEKTLELVGVGYRAAKQGENLVLNVNAAVTIGEIIDISKKGIIVRLKIPVCANYGDNVSISRRLGNRWRLIGVGTIIQ